MGKEAVQVTVQAEQEQLAKVPMVQVSHDVKQQTLNLPQHRLVRRREFVSCALSSENRISQRRKRAHVSVRKVANQNKNKRETKEKSQFTEFGRKDAFVVDGSLSVRHDVVDVLRRRQSDFFTSFINPRILSANRK